MPGPGSTRTATRPRLLVGVVALITVAGSVALVRHRTTGTVQFANGTTTLPVFEVPGVIDAPSSCRNVVVFASRPYWWVVSGTDGTNTAAVAVEDTIGGGGEAQSQIRSPWAYRDEPELLRLVVGAGPSADRLDPELAGTILALAALGDPARPETLHIRWPAGWHETAAGRPEAYSGQVSTGGLRGYRDIALAADDTTIGARTAEPAASVTLGWSDADPFLPGAVPGVWFGYAPESSTPPVFDSASRSIDGFTVGVSTTGTSGRAAPDAHVLTAQVRRAGLRCPVPAASPGAASAAGRRVHGTDWIVEVRDATTGCPSISTPGQTATYDSTLWRCADAIVATLNHSSGTLFVTSRAVASLRIEAPDGRVLDRQPVDHGATEGAGTGFAAVVPPSAGVDPVIVAALASDGTVLERVAWRLGCRFRSACSPEAALLATPGWTEKPAGNSTSTTSVHGGLVVRAMTPWPIDDQSGLGPPDRARTSEQWCGLVVVSHLAPFGGDPTEPPPIDGFATCVAPDRIGRATMHVQIATLDYVGAIQYGLVVVGPDVARVRISITDGSASQTSRSTESLEVEVHRDGAGPGVATFEDPGRYGDMAVTYEALDENGTVVARAESTANDVLGAHPVPDR